VSRPIPDPGFAGDDGSADPELAAVLADYARGSQNGQELVAALRGARLLVPVVAVLESTQGDSGDRREKDSSMATVTILGPDGRRALLAFTSVRRLTTWRADARPVPVRGGQAAQAALADGCDTLLVDVGGPATFALAGPELEVLARGW
jgi:hypothetical protein